jgi:site-specific DNA recombinase
MHYGVTMTVADFYGRKSSKDDGRSIAGQEDDYRADCAEEGLTVGRIFADPDRSASRYAKKERPDYLALLAHISAGDCQMLSMWDCTRGGRDLGQWVSLLDLCRKHGVLIRAISHKRTYDVRVRRDWRTLADEGVDAADESEKISERVKRGKRLSASKGLPTARLAYGFIRVYDERGHFKEQVEHPVQAPVVREIVEGIAAGMSSGSIAKALNARGVPAPLGGLWTDAQVRQIAIKPSYAGKRVHLGEVVGKGCWDPIVDPAVWQKAYDILSTPGRKPVADSRLAHWLTSVIACGLCGHPLGSTYRPTGMLAYQCPSCFKVSVSSRNLVGFLEPLIVARLDTEEALELFVQRDDERIAAADADLGRLEKRYKELEAEAAKPDGMSPAMLTAAERGLAPQIEAAKARLRKLTVPAALEGIDPVNMAGKWSSYGPHTRRTLVRAMAQIVLTPGVRNGVRTFDQWRLAGSRWTGDNRTWGEIWAATS